MSSPPTSSMQQFPMFDSPIKSELFDEFELERDELDLLRDEEHVPAQYDGLQYSLRQQELCPPPQLELHSSFQYPAILYQQPGSQSQDQHQYQQQQYQQQQQQQHQYQQQNDQQQEHHLQRGGQNQEHQNHSLHQYPQHQATSLRSRRPSGSPSHQRTPSRLQTPNRVRSHRRTRSRLSLDASGAAAIIMESSFDLRSPARNPFYTPSRSPGIGMSPDSTPLMGPAVQPFLLHSDYAAAADLTLRIAEEQQPLAASFYLSDPSISETVPQTIPTVSRPLTTHVSRSQSVLSLDAHMAPPEITKYDILVPRKRLAKSQSATDVHAEGKKAATHACPLCGGVFQRPEHLKRHMRSHSSEKPFECEECGKKFNRADNMKAHQRKLHE